MNNSVNKNWEEEFDFLAKMSKDMPFSLPENYFENSCKEIITQSTLLSVSNSIEGFKLPEHFMEDQYNTILRKVNQLENPEKIGGFNVPEAYFDSLSTQIQSKIEAGDSTKRKVLKIWTSDFLKYATAACFILITATALYFDNKDFEFINTNESAYFLDNDLYYIDEQMIIEHVDLSNDAAVSQSVSATEAENYILSNYSTSELLDEYR